MRAACGVYQGFANQLRRFNQENHQVVSWQQSKTFVFMDGRVVIENTFIFILASFIFAITTPSRK
jgi:hypothetical protein